MTATPWDLAQLRTRQQDCLSRQQAAALGLTTGQVRELRRTAGWESVHRGVLSVRPGVNPAERPLYAALLTQAPEGRWPPGLAISHTTAATYFGFEGLPADPVIHQVVPRIWIPRYRRPGLLLHHCHTPTEHVVLRNGIPLTDPAWTVLTLARCLPRDRAIVLADAALRSGECTLDELHAALPKIARLRGCVQAA